MKAAIDTLDSVIVERSLKKQNLCLDKGCDFLEIEYEAAQRRGYVSHIRQRGEDFTKTKKRYYYPERKLLL